jgi:hypothetical protein
MSLRVLETRATIESAQAAMMATLERGTQRFTRRLHWPSGVDDFEIQWRPRERFWFMLNGEREPTIYWNIFGTSDPNRGVKYEQMTCQATLLKDTATRRYGGVFVRGDHDEVYLAHTGKIGGGAVGVGRNAFIEHYRGGHWQTIVWPDGVETEAVLIGRVDSPRLSVQLGFFVHEVERIKALEYTASHAPPRPVRRIPKFSPEFRGTKKYALRGGTVESSCDHGSVVSALQSLLESKYPGQVGNQGTPDLYVIGSSGDVSVLFEVKTDISSTSIQQGVGQLFMYGGAEPKMPKLILVVPGRPVAKTKEVLQKLGIYVLAYDLAGDRVEFGNLGEVLE